METRGGGGWAHLELLLQEVHWIADPRRAGWGRCRNDHGAGDALKPVFMNLIMEDFARKSLSFGNGRGHGVRALNCPRTIMVRTDRVKDDRVRGILQLSGCARGPHGRVPGVAPKMVAEDVHGFQDHAAVAV